MPLPPLQDLAFWVPVLDENTWRDHRNGDVAMSLTDLMAVFIARGSDCARRVEGAVARRILERALWFVRRNVGRHHENAGYDIVDDVLCDIMEAMAKPEGKVARGLAYAFEARTRFLILDAFRARRGWASRASALDESIPAPVDDPEDALERTRTLARIADPRDRQMLQDHDDGHTWAEIGQRHELTESVARKRVQKAVALAAACAGDETKGRARP